MESSAVRASSGSVSTGKGYGLRARNSRTTSSGSPTETATISTPREESFGCRAKRISAWTWQGPHQVAQKS